MDPIIVPTFAALFMVFQNCFTQPSFESFKHLAIGWLLTPGRKTISNIIRTLGPSANKSHDAYQEFFSENKWDTDEISKNLFGLVLLKLKHLFGGKVLLAGDDTLSKHYGRKIFGIGIFRDSVRSTPKHPSFILAHNWVILYVVVKAPLLSNTFLAFPICSRLRPKSKKNKKEKKKQTKRKKRKVTPKSDKTLVDLMKEMIYLVISWAPNHEFEFVTDAGYACLLGELPENVHLISRIRKDAKLFALPPKRRKKDRGRPPKKGKRLLSPMQMAESNPAWEDVTVTIYGEQITFLVYSYTALWYEVSKDTVIKIIIVRDPEGEYSDQFFFTTDLDMPLEHAIESFSARWSVEVVHREIKQSMGMEEPQARLEKAVKRQVPFALLLLSLVKLWYLTEGYLVDIFKDQKDPWYKHKKNVSFHDMLSLLRYFSWNQRIFEHSDLDPDQRKIISPLIEFFARRA